MASGSIYDTGKLIFVKGQTDQLAVMISMGQAYEKNIKSTVLKFEENTIKGFA